MGEEKSRVYPENWERATSGADENHVQGDQFSVRVLGDRVVRCSEIPQENLIVLEFFLEEYVYKFYWLNLQIH